MCDPQMITSESGCMAVYHHRYRQIINHPPITEKRFYIIFIHHEFAEHAHVMHPSAVVIERILHAAPLSALPHLFPRLIQVSEALTSDLLSHYFAPPCFL